MGESVVKISDIIKQKKAIIEKTKKSRNARYVLIYFGSNHTYSYMVNAEY